MIHQEEREARSIGPQTRTSNEHVAMVRRVASVAVVVVVLVLCWTRCSRADDLEIVPNEKPDGDQREKMRLMDTRCSSHDDCEHDREFCNSEGICAPAGEGTVGEKKW